MSTCVNLRITKATVIITDGTDLVYLYTDLPCPYTLEFLPEQSPLCLTFETTDGDGVNYVRKHFGLNPNVVNMNMTG